MKYQRTQVVEAYQWFQVSAYVQGQVRDVDYFRSPDPQYARHVICDDCDRPLHDHGWVNVQPHGPSVCPGDWIVKEHGIIEVWDDEAFQESFSPCTYEKNEIMDVHNAGNGFHTITEKNASFDQRLKGDAGPHVREAMEKLPNEFRFPKLDEATVNIIEAEGVPRDEIHDQHGNVLVKNINTED